MMLAARSLVLVGCLAAAACGGTRQVGGSTTPKPTTDTESKPTELELEPLRIRVVRDASGATELEHYDARMLFDRGNAALAGDRFGEALEIYDRLVAEFPDSTLMGLSHFNAGQALEGMAEWDRAIARYRKAMASSSGRDSIDAQMRIGVLLSEQQRWQQASELFEQLLGRTDLSPGDRVEAMARFGYTLVEQKAYARAEQVLNEAVTYANAVRQTSELETDYFVGMAYYYLGNVAHRQARAVVLRVTSTADEDLQRDLEAKRSLIVTAYDRYKVSLNIQNAYWATASGYQMSQLFKEFWDDAVSTPIPGDLTPIQAGYYRRSLHDYMRRFLEKSLGGHTRNVELAEAYRASTEWSRASQQRAEEIAEILAREARGELVTPEAARAPKEAAPDAGGRPPTYRPARYEL